MQDLSHANPAGGRGPFGAIAGESADANEPFRLQNFQHAPQMFVADRRQPGAFGFGQLIRGILLPLTDRKASGQ